MASLPQPSVVPFPERKPVADTPPEPARSGLLRRIAREPLTHFVLLGAMIFTVMHWVESRTSRYTIRLGSEEIRRLTNSYEQQYGAPPDAAQQRTLVQKRIRQDIFFREAQALGLDREDEVIRRRIAQKYEFLVQDNLVTRTPSEAELQGYYAAHRQDYAHAARRTIEQVYFAIDERGDAAAKALAQQAANSAAPPAGDEFPGPKSASQLSQADLTRLFGDKSFAAAVFAAPPGIWTGPLRSGFGWHAVRVTEAQPGAPRSFADARADVQRDWTRTDRDAQNEKAYADLRQKYRVEVSD